MTPIDPEGENAEAPARRGSIRLPWPTHSPEPSDRGPSLVIADRASEFVIPQSHGDVRSMRGDHVALIRRPGWAGEVPVNA